MNELTNEAIINKIKEIKGLNEKNRDISTKRPDVWNYYNGGVGVVSNLLIWIYEKTR